MANPILTSDIYRNTGELEQLLEQLKAVEAQYDSLLKKTQTEAVKLQAKVEGLNIAHEGQKEQLKQAAVQTDKLEKAQAKYKEALSDTQTKILALRQATNEQNRIKKLEIKLADSAEGSYNRLSAQYSLNKIRLNQMSAAQRANTKEGQALVKQSKDIYEEMKRLQEETGKHTLNVGNYKDATKDLIAELDLMPGSLRAAGTGVGRLGTAFKALLANPIVAVLALIVGALGALFQGFRRSEQGAQLLTKATGFLQGVMSTITKLAVQVAEGLQAAFNDPLGALKSFGQALLTNIVNRVKGIISLFASLGEVIGKTVTGKFEEASEAAREAGEAFRQAVTGLDAQQQKAIANAFEETTKAVKANVQAFIELEQQKRRVAKANLDLARGIEGLRTEYETFIQIQEDDTLGFQVRQEAAEKAREATIALAQEEIKLARNNLGLLNQEIALRRNNGEDVLALQQQQLSAYQALAQAERDYTLSLADGEEKRRRLKQDTLERDLDILIDGLANQQAINLRRLKDEELTYDARRAILRETEQLAQGSFEQQIATIQQFTDQAVNANELLAESDAVALNARIRALGLSEIIEGRLLEVIRDRRTAILDLSEAQSELAAQEAKAAEIRRTALLKRAEEEQNLELEAFDQRQALANAEFNQIERTEAEKTRFRLEAERERLQKLIELNEAFQGDLSETEVATFRALITGINNELDSLAAEGEERNLYDLLGINLDDEQKQTLQDSFGFAKEQLTEWANFRAQIAAQEVEQANTAVQAARDELQAQLDLDRQGFASKVDTAQKELEEAKKNQAKALAEQRRAQRAQQRIQTAEQAANLLTASTKIWSQFGFPGALLPLGILWSSFISSKIRANQLTKKENRLGDFEYLGNSGNRPGAEDIFLGMTDDGRARTASKGESLAIFNAQATRKYSSLPQIVESLNQGTFEGLYKRATATEVPGFMFAPSVNTSRMEDELGRIRRNGEIHTYVDGQGRTVVVKGNRKTIYLS
jgi:hypothetical protein